MQILNVSPLYIQSETLLFRTNSEANLYLLMQLRSHYFGKTSKGISLTILMNWIRSWQMQEGQSWELSLGNRTRFSTTTHTGFIGINLWSLNGITIIDWPNVETWRFRFVTFQSQFLPLMSLWAPEPSSRWKLKLKMHSSTKVNLLVKSPS